jgi:hypothetical protein
MSTAKTYRQVDRDNKPGYQKGAMIYGGISLCQQILKR